MARDFNYLKQVNNKHGNTTIINHGQNKIII